MLIDMSETRATYKTANPRRQVNGGEVLSNAESAGFPGCEAVPMTAEQFERLERHIEYWDAQSGVAWMVRETTLAHERPAVRLAVLTHRIAQVRGAEITCCGTASLYDRRPGGNVRVMEADQIIYLDPERVSALHAYVQVRDGEGPDIVLEVDHTTDARRRKVGLYKQWRIPEIWVEVPDAPAPSRRKSRRSGLTIYALNERTKRYRQAIASTVLRGWTVAEIHTALNEPHVSEATWAALHRVGRALGEKEGTAPALDPQLRSLLLESQEEGWDEGRADDRRETVLAILANRGIDVPSTFAADLAAIRLATRPQARIVEAAFACRNAADFLARLRRGAERPVMPKRT